MALTPYLRLTKPPFDQIPWDQAINGDMDIIDGFIAQYMNVPNFAGTWSNSTGYIVGQVLLDTSTSSMWIAQVSHTSAASPTTFAADRVAHPTYWAAGSVPQGFLPITGGTLTGNLYIAPPTGASGLNIVASPGNNRQIVGWTGPNPRWGIELGTGLTESGSNAGSDFQINRYSDAGAYLNSPISVTRATGIISLIGNVGIGGNCYGNVFALNSGNGSFQNDSSYTYLYMSSANWRWQFNYTNANLAWMRGTDNAQLINFSSAGDIAIAGNGVKPGGGSWGSTSDARIKNVLGDYQNGLDAVTALHPVRYTFKNDALSKEYIGLVAQEAEISMPEMVTQINGEVDGQPVDDLRLLDMTALPLAIVNAIKELTQRIVALETVLASRTTQP